jgi:glycosyltransferase involved in cell wall biosynthesis
LNYLKAWTRLPRKYRLSEQFDLVDPQFGQSGLVALPSPLPLVVTFHGSDIQGFVDGDGTPTLRGRFLRRLSRIVARSATQNVVVAEHLARNLPPSATYTVIPCGIDLEQFRPISADDARRRLGLPRDRMLVLFPANPENPIKRYQLAKSTMDLVSREINADLLVVCNAPHEQMPLYMNASDALLLTSRHEGSPTVIKEALACNLPVVSVDVGDVRQRLQGIGGCRVCGDDDPQTIAGALAEVLGKGRRIEGRKAVSHLDLRHTTEQIMDVYHKALDT